MIKVSQFPSHQAFLNFTNLQLTILEHLEIPTELSIWQILSESSNLLRILTVADNYDMNTLVILSSLPPTEASEKQQSLLRFPIAKIFCWERNPCPLPGTNGKMIIQPHFEYSPQFKIIPLEHARYWGIIRADTHLLCMCMAVYVTKILICFHFCMADSCFPESLACPHRA